MDAKKYENILENFRYCWKMINHNYIQKENTSCIHGQGKLLTILADSKEKLSQKDLVLLMNISPPSLTELIKKCLKSGFIYQEKDMADRRYSYIRISEVGIKQLEEKKQVRTNAAIKVFSNLNDSENELLNDLLNKLIINIKEDLK